MIMKAKFVTAVVSLFVVLSLGSCANVPTSAPIAPTVALRISLNAFQNSLPTKASEQR